jgi:serine phosphatase RsbU (regulator of sigma subunit)
VFAPTFNGGGPVRSGDITRDPRYGRNSYGGLPPGHPPVRSYLAASVVSRAGEVLGGLFFGHAKANVFDERAEALAVGLAGHAAIGIDNARLFQSHRDAAVELQRSLLPGALADIEGLAFSSHYQPGAASSGIVVGGDWYDVLSLDDGRTAFVIGDVMGRGVRAAAAMGQLRTALRVLLSSGQPLDESLEHLDRLVSGLPGEQIATCLVGVHDPARQIVTLVSAGHLPALLLSPQAPPTYVTVEPAGPLGALVVRPTTSEVPFPSGSTLVMFTDGLVENRAESIDGGLERLLDQVLVHHPGVALSGLVDAMLEGGQDDDTAVLVVTAQ